MKLRGALVALVALAVGVGACASEPGASGGGADAGGSADIGAGDAVSDAGAQDIIGGDAAITDVSDAAGDGAAGDAVDATPGDADAGDGAAVDAAAQDAGAGPSGTWEQILPASIKKEHVFKGVWVADAAHILLAGVDGILVRSDGDLWTVLSEGEWPNFNGLWGTAADDAWAVGFAGAIAHWNGASWTAPSGCLVDGDCEDGDPCTVDSCDTTGLCSYAASGLAGCCGGAAFQAGFDDGAPGWTFADLYATDDTKGGILWQVVSFVGADGKPRYTSPPSALYFGDPAHPCMDGSGGVCPSFSNGLVVGATATSPSFTVPVAAKASASFNVIVDSETGEYFDRLTLAVLVGGVATEVWVKSETSLDFVPVQVDLSTWVGQEIQLRFAFDSVDSFGNEGEGAWIDDLVVMTSCSGDPGEAPAFGTLFDVWGSGPDDLWAVGIGGQLAHFGGTSWVPVTVGTPTPWAIRALGGAAGELLAGGEGGLLLETHGGSFVEPPKPPSGNINAVWAGSSTFRWAVGDGGVALLDLGEGWQAVTAPTGNTLYGVWGGASGVVYVVGDGGVILALNGGGFVPELSGVTTALRAVWTDGDAAIAVGDEGVALHRQGGSWVAMATGTTQPLVSLSALSATDAWAVGKNGVILRWDGAQWKDASNPLPADYLAVYAGAADDVWMVGDKGVMIHWVGGEYAQVKSPFGEAPLYALWGTGPTDVYAAGDGFVIHWNGTSWTSVATSGAPVNLRAVCGSAADNVLAVGAGGVIFRWDGKNWAYQPIDPIVYADGSEGQVSDQLHGCWARSAALMFAVGENGTVVEWDGTSWKTGSNQSAASLRSVWADSDEHAIAVGVGGAIVEWDGQQWLPMASGSVATLYDLHGTGLDNLYVVGDIGTILRFVPAK